MPARDNRSSSSYPGPPNSRTFFSPEERDHHYSYDPRRTGVPASAYRSAPADPYLHPAFLPDPSRPPGYAAPYNSSSSSSNFFPSRPGPPSDPAQFGLARSSRTAPSPPRPRPPPRARSPHRPRSPSPYTADQLRDQRAYRPPTATMSTDYQAYLEATGDLSRMTVDRLKRATRGINQALATNMRLSGKKNDLYTALLDTLAIEYDKPDKTRFHTCRRYISEAKLSTNPNGPTWSLPAASTSTGYTGGYNGYGQRQAPAAAATNGYGAAPGSNAGASTSTYSPAGAALPAPRFGGAYAQATPSTTPSWQTPRADEPPIRFRPSPFYRVEKALSSVATLIKAGPGDRKIATVRFKLTEPQLELLRKSKQAKSNDAQYQVRLYCTSDTNYNQIRPQAHQFPAPIEFPAACEVKLNNVLVPANTKGIKKQPGTAPPVNLSGAKGPAVPTTSSDMTHTVDLIYTNTEKVYYIVAYLIEYTPIDKIVGRVKAGKTRSKEEVIQGIIKLNDDPDVEASAFGLSLKDPLSYTRIETPIRSVHCQHIACFDAVTWFEINEQTPQWMCPICNKPLKVEDMVVDGYLEDILKICSSSVDSVTVEPDGTWRSDNDKFGTAKPRIAASSSGSVRNSPTPSAAGGDKKPLSGSGSGNGGGGGREAVTLELDSDDDDDAPLAKRPRLNGYSSFGGGGGGGGGGSSTPGGGRTGTGTPLSATNEILDLTLSSDDEGAPPPPPQSSTSTTANTLGQQHRPSIAMARTGSSEQKKGLEDVQRDIAAMNERMRRDYGENWRDHFGLHDAPQPQQPQHTGLPSPGPGA